jgi:hypothetical protein
MTLSKYVMNPNLPEDLADLRKPNPFKNDADKRLRERQSVCAMFTSTGAKITNAGVKIKASL